VDARGIPLSLVVSGANQRDMKLLAATLDGIVCPRPAPRKWKPQHLCADVGYKGQPARKAVVARNYRPRPRRYPDLLEADSNYLRISSYTV
jgi:putative transposase